MRNTTIFLVTVSSLFFLGCLKKNNNPPNFSIQPPALVSTTYDQMKVSVNYLFENYNDYLMGGIYWADHPNPTDEDHVLTEYNVKNDMGYFTLEDLYANETYYIKGWLDTPSDADGNGGGIITSEEVSFTTEQLPEVSCAVSTGEIDFGVFNFSMSPITQVNGLAEAVTFRTTYDYGYLDFLFNEYPKSYIYKTVGFGTLAEHEVTLLLHHQGAWTCVYEITDYMLNVHVFNDDQGGLRFSFCDIVVGTSSGCNPTHFTLTGEVAN